MLTVDDLKSLHKEFIARDCYQFSMAYNDPALDFSKLKEAIKIGIRRINIDDLKSIAPDSIKKVVHEFMKQDEDTPINPTPEPVEHSHDEQDNIDSGYPSSSQEQSANDDNPSNQSLPGGYDVEKTSDRKTDTINSGTNIMPGKSLVCDTARRLLRGIAYQNQFHMTNPKERHKLSYVFQGVTVRGDPVALVPEGARDAIPVSMMDLTGYYLAEIYRKYRKADKETKILEAEIGMFRRHTEQNIRKMHQQEMILILDALED